MIRIAIIAVALLSIGTANAETGSPAKDAATNAAKEATKDAAKDAAKPSFPLLRNIGIAEMGDAIVVRERAAATKSEQK